jgi:hypothetical protein
MPPKRTRNTFQFVPQLQGAARVNRGKEEEKKEEEKQEIDFFSTVFSTLEAVLRRENLREDEVTSKASLKQFAGKVYEVYACSVGYHECEYRNLLTTPAKGRLTFSSPEEAACEFSCQVDGLVMGDGRSCLINHPGKMKLSHHHPLRSATAESWETLISGADVRNITFRQFTRSLLFNPWVRASAEEVDSDAEDESDSEEKSKNVGRMERGYGSSSRTARVDLTRAAMRVERGDLWMYIPFDETGKPHAVRVLGGKYFTATFFARLVVEEQDDEEKKEKEEIGIVKKEPEENHPTPGDVATAKPSEPRGGAVKEKRQKRDEEDAAFDEEEYQRLYDLYCCKYAKTDTSLPEVGLYELNAGDHSLRAPSFNPS